MEGGLAKIDIDFVFIRLPAHNLSSIEEGGFRDPYVRLSLDPEVDGRKRETGIHRGEVHPYFNEHFKFPVSRDQLQGKELVLQVFDYDRYSHNDIIGEVRIGLDDMQLSKSAEVSRLDVLWSSRRFESRIVHLARNQTESSKISYCLLVNVNNQNRL